VRLRRARSSQKAIEGSGRLLRRNSGLRKSETGEGGIMFFHPRNVAAPKHAHCTLMLGDARASVHMDRPC
jgi:hypothetical protein